RPCFVGSFTRIVFVLFCFSEVYHSSPISSRSSFVFTSLSLAFPPAVEYSFTLPIRNYCQSSLPYHSVQPESRQPGRQPSYPPPV
ncbi:hypothetical protein HOY82DRAFT_672012, partial [Tuber indicum]